MQEENYNGRGYGCFVMVVAAIALLLSIISLLKWDNPLSGLGGEDYTIVALSVLVTFVVAWQIWQTIISREEVRNIDRRFENVRSEFNKRVDAFYSDFNNDYRKKISSIIVDLAKDLKDDYESSIAIMDNLSFLRSHRTAIEMLLFSANALKTHIEPDTIKKQALIRAIEASSYDALNEAEKHRALFDSIPIENLIWLQNLDYTKHGCRPYFNDFDEYISTLDKLVAIHREHHKKGSKETSNTNS